MDGIKIREIHAEEVKGERSQVAMMTHWPDMCDGPMILNCLAKQLKIPFSK